MPEQPSRTLVEAKIDMRRGIAGREDLWGFQLTFRMSPLARGVEESVRAWVEPAGIQRTVQRHVLGRSDEDTSITTKIDDRPYPLLDEGHRRLREFLYLWTRDVQQVDEQVRPLLERNLWSLRTSREYRPDPHEQPLAYAQLYMYDHIPTDDQGSIDEALRYMGAAATRAGLRQIVLELPQDCSTFEIHFKALDRIIGNAEYRVEQEVDWRTGKRGMLDVIHEFGACENVHRFFQDLYNTQEEFNTSVELS